VAELRRTHHRAPKDIEEALDALQVRIWKTNDDEITGYCPGHMERLGREERHPSWSVNRESGLHNCYSCGFQGTFLELVMYLQFPNDVFRAARWLRQFGTNLARASELGNFASREREDLDAEIARLEMVPETKLAMYDEAPDWALEARHLDRESVDHYGVRWSTKRESWIIPVRAPNGDLMGWQEKWEKKRRFINTPKEMVKSLTLFGYCEFPIGEPAVVLESPLDVLRLFTIGYEGGLATMGSSVSQAQKRLLIECTEELVEALDNDKAGRQAAAELVDPTVRKLLHVRHFNYGRSDEKDIGTMDAALVTYGLYEAQHYIAAGVRSEQEKQHGFHRKTQAVSGRSSRANGRPRAVPPDSRRGNRQDPDDRGRSRGAR
jgi:hypothetical protein